MVNLLFNWRWFYTILLLLQHENIDINDGKQTTSKNLFAPKTSRKTCFNWLINIIVVFQQPLIFIYYYLTSHLIYITFKFIVLLSSSFHSQLNLISSSQVDNNNKLIHPCLSLLSPLSLFGQSNQQAINEITHLTNTNESTEERTLLLSLRLHDQVSPQLTKIIWSKHNKGSNKYANQININYHSCQLLYRNYHNNLFTFISGFSLAFPLTHSNLFII
jgi:hypothetical protein